LPEAAWINKPKAESNDVALAETIVFPGVVGDGSPDDRRSWGILETNFLGPAGKTKGNDIKFKVEVSQNH